MIFNAPLLVPAKEMLHTLSYRRGAPELESHHPVAGLQVGLAPRDDHFDNDVVLLAVYEAGYVGEAVGPFRGLAGWEAAAAIWVGGCGRQDGGAVVELEVYGYGDAAHGYVVVVERRVCDDGEGEEDGGGDEEEDGAEVRS